MSRYLATRGNNKILRTLLPHISSSVEILPTSLVAPLSNSEQTNLLPLNHAYTTSTPTHTSSSTAPTYTPHCRAWIYGRPRWSDGATGQMEKYAGWWTKSWIIGLPPQTRVKGVGRQQQQGFYSIHLINGGNHFSFLLNSQLYNCACYYYMVRVQYPMYINIRV